MAKTLRQQVNKRDPFDSIEQEAYLNMQRTAAELGGFLHAFFKAEDLSSASYNILRILRGHKQAGQEHGCRASDIGCEMFVRLPDVTRLVDRLERMGLVERRSCSKDRRVVYVRITRQGLRLLDRMDKPLQKLHTEILGHMSKSDLKELNRLLALARETAEEQCK